MEIETELSAPGLAAGTGRGSFFRTRYIQQGTFVAEDYSMEEVLGSWRIPGQSWFGEAGIWEIIIPYGENPAQEALDHLPRLIPVGQASCSLPPN